MSTASQQVADQVRGIPLGELLNWHGFKMTKEGASIRARNKQHNIVVTGNKWFDNKTGVGGAGAIDLQMHLCGGDFQTTCHILAEGFRPLGAGLAFPPGKRQEDRRKPFEELAAQYAVPSTGNWPVAREYLVETRKIDAPLVDELHEHGSIYANIHRPNPGIVFLHRSQHGKVEGATLRDTRHESSFRPCLGNKLSAWFSIGDLANAQTVVAVESPIEALSYHSLFAGRNDPLAIVSCSGSFVPEELMFSDSPTAFLSEVRSERLSSPPARNEKSPAPDHGFVDAKEAAAFLGIPLRSLHQYVRQGLLPSYKLGRHRLFRRFELLHALQSKNRATRDEILR